MNFGSSLKDLREQIVDQLGVQTKAQDWNQVWVKVKIRTQFWDQVHNQVWKPVRDQVWEDLK